MKDFPKDPTEDYDGNKGCLIMIISYVVTITVLAVAFLIGIGITNLIKLL